MSSLNKLIFLKAFKPAFESKNRYLLLQGGRGSGKSRFAVMKVIVRMLTENNANFLLVRKTMPALRRSIWKTFRSVIRDYSIDLLTNVDVNKSEWTIRIGDNEAVFVAIDDPDKLKSLENITAGVVMEEALEFTYDDFISLDTVLRAVGADYKQMMIIYNPDRRTSFVYKTFIETEHPDTYVHISTIDNNTFIRDTYKPILESIKDSEKRKSWLLGEWAEYGNLILQNYTIKEFDIDSMLTKGTRIAGIDWGFNNPSAFLLIVIYDDVVYVCDEIYIAKVLTEEFCDKIAGLIKSYNIKESSITVYPENAEPDRNEILKNKLAMFVSAIKKDKSQEIATLREHDIVIHPNCENLIKEIGSWQYMTDKDGNITEKPSDGFDHAIDALCYSVRNHFANDKSLVFIPA